MHRHHQARARWGARCHSLLLSAAASIALVVAPSACRNSGANVEDPTAGAAADGGEGTGSQAVSTQWHRPGAGHTSNIDLVAISSDGKAALTRDQIGGTRLWPKLDGSEEPIIIPVQGPQQMSLATGDDGAVIVAVVDASGGGQIFEVAANRGLTPLGALAPFQPLFGLYVLPGGTQVLGLFRDHTIRLLDTDAAELVVFEERQFRPSSLRIAADGKRFAAVTPKVGNPGTADLQSFVVGQGKDGGKPTVRKQGAARTIEVTTPITETTGALSPDGRHFVVVDKPAGNTWDLSVTKLDEEAAATTVSVQMPAHVVPNLGFVGEHEVLVSTNDGTLSWLIDLEDRSLHARTSAPQDFVNQGRAQALASGVQAAGFGTWLFVHDVEARSHRYLGYRSFQTQSVAVSPSGDWVAWAYMAGPVFVESLGGDEGERVKLPAEPNVGAVKVRFFDDEHLITIDGAGGISLYRWRDAALVGMAGVHGAIRALHFEPKHGVMLVERHSNDARLFEVGPQGFTGPYIVADQSFRSGLLAKGTLDHPEAIMWSLDSGNVLRHYTLEELRSDLSHADVQAKGKPIPTGKVAPLAIDRFGRHYGVRWNGSTMELFVDFGRHLETKVSATGDVSTIVPSPSGHRFVAVHQRGQSTSLSVHDSETLEESWSFATGVFNNEVVWSPDGRFVAVAANTGAVVLDAKDGKPVQRRCGIEFTAVGAPPNTAFNSLNLRSMCEG
ncbi:MAG: WD40 repeat domain-containing protein [Deltaproteobacteria bacterium]|nr:WD40 repeat domain-containing protein [Deltaproteobacteria bacterium]